MKFPAGCITTLMTAALVGAIRLPTVDTGVITKGITTDELAKFKLLAQYAGATYCYDNFRGNPHKMACSNNKGNCPLVESANATNIHPFMTRTTRTAGYLAVDNTNKLIVVSFQGTDLKENPQSLATNMNLIQVRTQLCKDKNRGDGCVVHGGFYYAALAAMEEISKTFSQAVQENPNYQIVATGHSLGGALAAIVGTMLRNGGHIVDIVTYGQPHIGAHDISKYIRAQAPEHGLNYRITHDNDVVPQLPRYEWGPWGHFYPEYFITIKTGDVTEQDISKINGDFFTLKGNEGQGSARGPRTSLKFIVEAKKGVAAHLDYFGPLTNCDSAAPKPPKESKKKGSKKVAKIEKVEKVDEVDKLEIVEKVEEVTKVAKVEKVDMIEKIEKIEEAEKIEESKKGRKESNA